MKDVDQNPCDISLYPLKHKKNSRWLFKIPRWLGGVIRHSKFSRFRIKSNPVTTPPHLDWLVAEEMVIRGSRVRRLPGRQYAISWYGRSIYCQFDLHTKKIHITYPYVPKGGLRKTSLLKRHEYYCQNKWITNKNQHKETCFCIHSMIPT